MGRRSRQLAPRFVSWLQIPRDGKIALTARAWAVRGTVATPP